MRLATWNLERGGRTRGARDAQRRVLAELAADVVVLTEPGPEYEVGPGVVVSPRLRRGPRGLESWIAVVGHGIEEIPLQAPFERMAVAARGRFQGRTVAVYGSVLPWATIATHAPELVCPGETALETFCRVLREQVADIRGLRVRFSSDLIVWAGDFNQTVSGPNRSGSHAKRRALRAALEELGLFAWNGEAAHAAEGLHAIDLLCGPRDVVPARAGRIPPILGAVAASDHAGYWVEL